MMTLKDFDLVGSLHNISNYEADCKDLCSSEPSLTEICLADRTALSEHIKSDSDWEKADKGAKATGNTNSFRVEKQRKNRHFMECSKWVEENLHKLAKM